MLYSRSYKDLFFENKFQNKVKPICDKYEKVLLTDQFNQSFNPSQGRNHLF